MKFTNRHIISIILLLLIAFSCTKDKDDEPVEDRTFEMELQELEAFIKELETTGLDVEMTDLGVYYVMYEEGTGPYPSAGDTCYLEYLAFHPDGTEFDATRDYANDVWEFIYLYQDLPTGLNDGLALMNEGTFMDIIIPSHLAFGSEGTKQVPPYTTVIYRSTMHEIKFIEEQ